VHSNLQWREVCLFLHVKSRSGDPVLSLIEEAIVIHRYTVSSKAKRFYYHILSISLEMVR
jgi:hypothetical protein